MAYDEELAARVRDVLEGEPGLSERRMFGGLAFLINGNLAVSASAQGGLLVHVDPEATPTLLADPHARRAEMRGRQMDGWLRVDADGLATPAALETWVRQGLDRARDLPAKL
jgi:TfoX/Sxy family transcriptional regulator of competence genes